MSNIICHPYHIVDESPWPLFGEIEDSILINRVFLVFILFLTLFLLSILFRDKQEKKSKKTKPNNNSSRGGNNSGGGGKKDPYNFKPRSSSPNSKASWDKGYARFLESLKQPGYREESGDIPNFSNGPDMRSTKVVEFRSTNTELSITREYSQIN